MDRLFRFWLVLIVVNLACFAGLAAEGPMKGPLRVHPRNPRYFTDGSGKAIYLTGSHTWANLQDQAAKDPPPKFDYDRYLDFLQARHHNFIRLWAWEQARWAPWSDGKGKNPNDWFIQPNPYARTGPGLARDGKPKFDLSKFDPAYFQRLRERVQKAGKRGIYVSVMLFQGWSSAKGWYGGRPWLGHPYHPDNNVQKFNGNLKSDVGPDLSDPRVRKHQAAYLQRVVDTINDLDNVLYEVTNEGGTKDWDWWVVRTVQEYERTKARQHPVGLTGHGSENNEQMLASPAVWISPGSDGWRDLKTDPRPAPGTKVSLLDTDHVFGVGGDQKWVWKGFVRGHNVLFMDPYDDPQWTPILDAQGVGVRGPEAPRRAMGHARRYAERMNLAEATPRPELASTGYCLACPGREYLVYLPDGGAVKVDLSGTKGKVSVEWLHPITGKITPGGSVDGGDWRSLKAPFAGDAVAYLRAEAGANKPPVGPRSQAQLGNPPPRSSASREGKQSFRKTRSKAELRNEEKKTRPAASQKPGPDVPALRVSQNGRHVVRPDGKPFFWLGDTAWLLFQMTTREDAELYLATRARQGFTVIQAAVVMGEERVGGTLRPNRYGDLAFSSGNPAKPSLTAGKDFRKVEEYDYWDHADYIVERAAAHGLTLGLLPLFVGYNGDGYKYLTPENAYSYGLFLGQRYRNRPHILWILGGDNTPDRESKQKVWNEVARGITVGVTGREDYGQTLMTYHINGNRSSSQWFHKAPWLDFNMIQVWGNEKEIFPTIAQDYRLAPVKPTGLGEGSYENGPQYSTRPINALKIRNQAYWSYFAGGYHTYGNTDTWNFSSYKDEAVQDWKKALESPGAAHLSVLAKLFATIEWWKLVPDPSAFASGMGSGATLNAAMRSTSGDRLLVYLSHPGEVTVRLDRITAATTATAKWIDPQTGARSVIGQFPTTGTRAFSSPKGWQDAVLLLDCVEALR